VRSIFCRTDCFIIVSEKFNVQPLQTVIVYVFGINASLTYFSFMRLLAVISKIIFGFHLKNFCFRTTKKAEGVFGVLKQDYGFRRFLCRGKNNIRTEFLVLGLAYNIKKLFSKISENRLGISLFELKRHKNQQSTHPQSPLF